ncbi:hypothetical protein RIF29_13919 [Crotalaria pallida]|uniref:Uncharacterized protein n=1 Tax=Crotalaria pallida TaxID=3830 RepID=A0AAN9FAU5_CROPI
MKIKGKNSKLNITIPPEIDRAIGENARHGERVWSCSENESTIECDSWKQACSLAGDIMWKEIKEKFTVAEDTCRMKMQGFVVDTMQRLYRLWKSRLHQYYKSMTSDEERLRNPPLDLPQDQWEYCVRCFGSDEFKNDDGVLEWADQERSKKIHPRSGYVHGKGTALRGYAKGQHQLRQQQEFQKQNEIIKEQAQKIKELEVVREQDKQELLGAMDALKQQMFEMFAAQRGVIACANCGGASPLYRGSFILYLTKYARHVHLILCRDELIGGFVSNLMSDEEDIASANVLPNQKGQQQPISNGVAASYSQSSSESRGLVDYDDDEDYRPPSRKLLESSEGAKG